MLRPRSAECNAAWPNTLAEHLADRSLLRQRPRVRIEKKSRPQRRVALPVVRLEFIRAPASDAGGALQGRG